MVMARMLATEGPPAVAAILEEGAWPKLHDARLREWGEDGGGVAAEFEAFRCARA